MKEKKDSHWNNPEEKNPKNCSVCGELVFLKDGQMKLWNDECRIIGVMEDGYTCKTSKPFVLAHFHPNCAKEYFVDKNQPNQNGNSRLKEKLLRNLDKICLDPHGWLANTEIVKRKDLESNYYKNNSVWKEIESKIHKVEIEGEEINLTLHSGGINERTNKK